MSLSNDDIKQLIGILQKALVQQPESEDETIEEEHEPQKSVKTKQKKSTGRKSAPTYNNKFDAMPERNMHKSDSKIDKLLNVTPPSERTREFNFVDVICRVCGRKESVNPALISDSVERYKCNRCAKVPG